MTVKSISLGDLALLKKVLAMTTSENDGEALTAIRKANAILKKGNLSWADVLERTVSAGPSVVVNAGPIGEPKPAQEATLEEQIQHAFDTLRGVPLGGFRIFIDSLEEQFNEKKYLSQAQRAPLFEAYKNHKARMKE